MIRKHGDIPQLTERTCAVPDCPDTPRPKYCSRHNQRITKYGDPNAYFGNQLAGNDLNAANTPAQDAVEATK